MELLFMIIGFGVAAGFFYAWNVFDWGLSRDRKRRKEFIKKYALSLEAAYRNEKLFCRQVGIQDAKQAKFHFMPSGLGGIDFSIWHNQGRLEIRDKDGNCFIVPFTRVEEAEKAEAVIKDMKSYLARMAGPGQTRLDMNSKTK